MSALPAKVSSRISAALKHFQPILQSAHARDVNESDTVIIVTDMLAEVFGYDKYSEISSEHAIRGTYCDLAIKLDGVLAFLVEVKAIGMTLKDAHIKQAIDYAANQGVDWVVLTNGVVWRIYKVGFGKPISHDLVVEVHVLDLNPRQDAHLELAFLLSKEGWKRSRLGEYQLQKEALSRFCVAALLLSDPMLETLRRELRRITPGLKVDLAEVKAVLETDVLKREVLEGDKAIAAKRSVSRAAGRALRTGRGPEIVNPTATEEENALSDDSDDASPRGHARLLPRMER
jgi:hypothetical protein